MGFEVRVESCRGWGQKGIGVRKGEEARALRRLQGLGRVARDTGWAFARAPAGVGAGAGARRRPRPCRLGVFACAELPGAVCASPRALVSGSDPGEQLRTGVAQ